MFSEKKTAPVGVGKTPELIGGLLMVLPDMDSGGVAGYMYASPSVQSVFKCRGRSVKMAVGF